MNQVSALYSINSIKLQKSENILYKDAKPDQVAFLTDFAMRSNAHYGYRTVSDSEAEKVFHFTEDALKTGVFRFIKVGKEIVGFYGLLTSKKNEKDVNRLHSLFLDPKYIGKGYGKILFQEAMRVAKEELHWESLEWESDPFAAWFYIKMGAKQIGENVCPLNPDYKSPVFEYRL